MRMITTTTISLQLYIYNYTHTHTYIYIYIHIYIHTHTHTHIGLGLTMTSLCAQHTSCRFHPKRTDICIHICRYVYCYIYSCSYSQYTSNGFFPLCAAHLLSVPPKAHGGQPQGICIHIVVYLVIYLVIYIVVVLVIVVPHGYSPSSVFRTLPVGFIQSAPESTSRYMYTYMLLCI